MNYPYKLFFQISMLVLLCSCCTEETDDMKNKLTNGRGTVCFTIHSLSSSVEEAPLNRSIADTPQEIKQVWCVIHDGKGNINRTFHLRGTNTDKLYVEGIEPGNYIAYFMATTEDISPDSTVPEDVTQPWIAHSHTGIPFEKDYLYKKVGFTVSSDVSNQTMEVRLPRLTGRVEVLLSFDSSQLEQLIQKIEIVPDAEAKVSNVMLGNGTYDGEDILAPIDITRSRAFFSLPGKELSGVVRITQKIAIDSMETSIVEYRFNHLDIIPGFISTIRLAYSHSEESYGEIKVNESSYTADNSSIMFMESEPASMITTRRFKVDEPLNVSIDTPDKKLVTRLFAPVELRDTEIWIKFKKYGDKYFLLAHYGIIHPFQESKIDIPVMFKQCKFTGEDGEQVWIPAQEDLSMSNCELKIVYSDSPYIQKIKTIKCHWEIGFQKASANTELSPKVLKMTPDIARHICALAVNVAYMFSTDYFQSELDKLNGLYDDMRIPINKTALMNKLFSKEKFEFGILEYNILAEGLTVDFYRISMYQEYYTFFYMDRVSRQARIAFFHEFGHGLGYGHNSNMTLTENGGESLWPPFCMDRFQELCYMGDLPVLQDIVSDLPK